MIEKLVSTLSGSGNEARDPNRPSDLNGQVSAELSELAFRGAARLERISESGR
jgi:hypothetical protein